MKLSERDCENLIDALSEWQECVGCKEMDENDVGLDGDRYEDLMTRLGARYIQHSTDIREKEDKMNNTKYMWILDASSGGVFKFEIPRHFPENGDYEKLVMSILPKDVRIQDCSWQEGTEDVQTLDSRANPLGQYW